MLDLAASRTPPVSHFPMVALSAASVFGLIVLGYRRNMADFI